MSEQRPFGAGPKRNRLSPRGGPRHGMIGGSTEGVSRFGSEIGGPVADLAYRLVQSEHPLLSKSLSPALMVTTERPLLLLLSMMLSRPSPPVIRAQ